MPSAIVSAHKFIETDAVIIRQALAKRDARDHFPALPTAQIGIADPRIPLNFQKRFSCGNAMLFQIFPIILFGLHTKILLHI